MKILVDDARDETHLYKNDYIDIVTNMDVIIRTYDAAKIWFDMNCACDHLFIDHDLGTEKNGYDLMCYIEENSWIAEKVTIVSDNPVGRRRIERLLEANGYHRRKTIWEK